QRLNPAVDSDLETICLKCLEKDPERRYDSAAALAEDLRRYLAGEPIHARPTGTIEHAWRWSKRNPLAASLATVVAALLVATAIGTSLAAYGFKRLAGSEQVARASAVNERNDARAARDSENAVRRDAEALAESRRQFLYAARINLARQAWLDRNVGRAIELLESVRAQPGQADLRGFEWHYLWRICHGEKLRLSGQNGPVRSVAFAPGGQAVATASGLVVTLSDPVTGKLKKRLWGHDDAVLSVAFS